MVKPLTDAKTIPFLLPTLTDYKLVNSASSKFVQPNKLGFLKNWIWVDGVPDQPNPQSCFKIKAKLLGRI